MNEETPTLAEQIEAVEFAAAWDWKRLTDEAQPKLKRWLKAAIETLRSVERATAILEALHE